MSKIRLITFCVVVFTTCVNLVLAQTITKEDYLRAEQFRDSNLENKYVFNLYMNQNHFADSSGIWQLYYDENGKEFQVVWFDEMKKKPLFDHKKVAENISKLTNEDVEAGDLPFDWFDYQDRDNIVVSVKGSKYNLNLSSGELTKKEEEKKEKQNRMESESPDGKWIAFVKDYNLYIRSTESDEEYQLSSDGKKNYEYGSYYGWYDLMKGENGDRPERFSVNWSADSKWLRSNVCDLRNAEKMYLLDYSVDTLFRPVLYSYFRGSPGDTTLVHMTPVIYNVATKKEVEPRLQPRTHINTYSVEWIKGQDKVMVLDQERGYQKLHYQTIDLNTGQRETMFTETSETRIGNKLDWDIVGDNFVFASERSGWNHLYVYNFKTKRTKAITKGEFVVNSLYRVDKKTGTVFFMASGKNADMNPYHQQLYSVSISGKKLKNLTPEPVNHRIRFSPDGKYFTDRRSTVSQPTVHTLREAATGKVLVELGMADASKLAELNWKAPEPFTAIAKDGKTTIYGAVWKPSNFDPNKKYPVIDATYTGPHTQMFPRRFASAFWRVQALAELGFLVVKIDGLGTNGRSKAFQDVSYKDMGNNLEDHVLAIKQLAEKNSWVDVDRVGIFGHSAGGYDTGHALLAFPDFYKVGVASSADHDFRMEKAWWPEMYMGWPVDSSYHEVSNITMAGNLKGKLLIVHGGMDENVNPSATFKLAEALVKADKDFDMLIMPSQHHGYRGAHSNYFRKRLWNYFVEHLLGAEPIWNYKD